MIFIGGKKEGTSIAYAFRILLSRQVKLKLDK
jgi:hypothetical protein